MNSQEIKEFDTNQEETGNLMRSYEDDILGALLEAADYAKSEDEIIPIEVARNGKVLFTFRIHPLSESDYQKCRKRNTKYVRNKQIGITIPEETNAAAYRNALIYEATVDEDRKKVWGNQEAWKRLDVLSGPELIGKVLKAGEKDAICDKIDEISGFNTTIEETVKN